MHDIDGMIKLFGSEEYFVSELQKFMEDAAPKRAHRNPGAGYWIGNQHDIHTPYLFANAGRRDLTQKWVRWTLENRFSTDIDGLDGNVDGGTKSAWYVFSAMGLVRNVWILAEGKQKYLWAINLSGALINVVLNAILIPFMGANGAALASLATHFFSNFILGFILKPMRKNNELMLRGLNPKYLCREIVALKDMIKSKK